MDKTIITALLIMAGVISAVAVFNAIFPAITQSSDAMTSMERRIDQRMQSQIEVIHAARGPGNTALIWVKNVGSLRITTPETCDLFFGPEGSFTRIPYGASAGLFPYWEAVVEGADPEWRQGATLRITVNYGVTVPGTGTYFIKIVLPNGISADSFASW